VTSLMDIVENDSVRHIH